MAATRRLAAIMFTDMVGYTASTQTDETRALELLHDQEEVIRPLVTAYNGREIKSTGDGFLVEFDSALKATQCAVDIQREIYERNAHAGAAPYQIRIGIHLGDVEPHGTDILGDAVNIAARIEPIAEPGGVCVSGAVYEQIWNKVSDRLEKLPPKTLKGVQAPMDVYRVVLPWSAPEPLPATLGSTGLAVLPFTNISSDPRDEYIADGLTEELITVLAHVRELRVIARTSVTPYKSTSKGVLQIGTELGVSSVLEGSVRKAGNRLRITVQLIDVATQGHVWAITYDRELDDVFAIQTEIAKRVAKHLRVNVGAAEEAHLEVRPPVRPDSYLAYLKGRTLLHGTSRGSLEAAKKQFDLAIAQDPKNAAAHSGLADVLRVMGWLYPGTPRSEWDVNGRRLAARAIELDPNLAEAHTSLALIQWDDFEYPAAEKEFRLALSLSPNYSLAHHWYAVLLEDEARGDEALRELMLADAADPLWSYNLFNLARLLSWLGRLDEALPWTQKLGEVEPAGTQYHVALAQYYLARTDLKRCLEEFHRLEEMEAEPRWKSVFRSWYLALSGEKEQTRALLRSEEELPEFPSTASDIAMVYAELDDLDECFHWLEKAIRTHNVPLHPFRLYPRFAHVRSDPRFQGLLKKMNLG